jgi:mitofusin 2
VHSNSTRIVAETRKVLRFPAANLNVALQRNVEGLEKKKEEVGKVRTESEVARKYFGNLVREAHEGKRSVEGVDLEGPGPGVAASHGA